MAKEDSPRGAKRQKVDGAFPSSGIIIIVAATCLLFAIPASGSPPLSWTLASPVSATSLPPPYLFSPRPPRHFTRKSTHFSSAPQHVARGDRFLTE
jgi:hypothetical protein